MSVWTINGDELADLNLLAPRRTRRNQIADQLTLNQAVRDVTAEPLWAVDELITVKKDGVPFFTGKLSQVPRRSESGEFIGYVIDGPWRDLERTPYLQAWPADVGSVYLTTILLQLDSDAQLISTRAQLKIILDWCLARAAAEGLAGTTAPFQYSFGDILAGFEMFPMIDEVRNVSCADAIKRVMRHHPDAVIAFDYATEPPTLKITRRDAMPANTQAITDLDPGWNLNPRHDLQVSGIVIKYRRTSVINGRNRLALYTDAWPLTATGMERDALSYAVDLAGETISYLSASVETAPIEASSNAGATVADGSNSPTRIAWWMEHSDAYASAYAAGRIINPVITNPQSDQSDASLTNELIAGQIAPWMSFGAEEATFTAELSCEVLSDDGQTIQIVEKKTISVRVVVTDAVTGDYTTRGESDTGDPLPPMGGPTEANPTGGLAYILYGNLAQLFWEGEVSITAEEVDNQFSLGTVLNLTGGRTEWATMRGLIQSVTEDWENGRTTAAFGPPGHLGLDDYISLLKMGRYRQRFIAADTLSEGVVAGGKLDLGDNTPKRDSQPGFDQNSFLNIYKAGTTGSSIISNAATGEHKVVSQGGGAVVQATVPAAGGRKVISGPSGSVDINSADCAGKTLTVRQIKGCDPATGQTYYMLVIGSPPSTSPIVPE